MQARPRSSGAISIRAGRWPWENRPVRRPSLIVALVALVMLDAIVWTAAVVTIAVAATAERRVSVPGLAVGLVGVGLVWLTLRAARGAFPPRR